MTAIATNAPLSLTGLLATIFVRREPAPTAGPAPRASRADLQEAMYSNPDAFGCDSDICAFMECVEGRY